MSEYRFDAVIIGAGVVGCAVARELSAYRLNIAVIERAADVSQGASKANSGLVHAGFDCEPGTLKAKYNVKGNAMYDELCEELGVNFRRTGALVAAFDEQDEQKLEQLLERGKKNDVPGLRIVRGEELRAMEPNLSDRVTAALFAPTAGVICPYSLTCALADAAAVNGAQFIFDAPVESITACDDGWLIKAGAHTVTASAVINAAGTHADEIYAMVTDTDFRITARRGEYWMIDRTAAASLPTRTVFFTPSERGKGVLFSPTVDGTLLIGPTAYAVECKDDVRTTAEGLDSVFEQAKRLCPSINKGMLFTTFAGNRATGSTGDFVVGRSPEVSRFYNAMGIESPGLSSAPAIARELAQQVVQDLKAQKKGWNELGEYIRPGKRFFEMNDAERAEAIAENPLYGSIVCRCELVTEAEVRAAIRRPVGARTLDGVKIRTRAGMGRCQSGFCCPRTAEILSEELGIDMTEITKFGGSSEIITDTLLKGGSEE